MPGAATASRDRDGGWSKAQASVHSGVRSYRQGQRTARTYRPPDKIMTTLLSARELTKSYPSSTLFEGVAIHISEGERLGLIGPNGAGKSTLLKILADIEEPDDGEIIRRRGLKMVRFGERGLHVLDSGE